MSHIFVLDCVGALNWINFASAQTINRSTAVHLRLYASLFLLVAFINANMHSDIFFYFSHGLNYVTFFHFFDCMSLMINRCVTSTHTWSLLLYTSFPPFSSLLSLPRWQNNIFSTAIIPDCINPLLCQKQKKSLLK